MKKTKKPKKYPASYLPGSRAKLTIKRHLLPPLAGISVMLIVVSFLNSQFIVAKVAQRTYKAPTEGPALDANLQATPPDPSAPAKLTINTVGVEAPVMYDQTKIDEGAFQLALRNGVVHYPNTAVPGAPGNVVIFGHSSGQAWAPGNYKFIFTHLDKLEQDHKIFLDYQGTRYTYSVIGKKVVPPTDISVLEPTEEHTLTLITCTPVGTNKNRLIITARQTAPVPTPAQETPEASSGAVEVETLPSQASTSFWESVRALF